MKVITIDYVSDKVNLYVENTILVSVSSDNSILLESLLKNKFSLDSDVSLNVNFFIVFLAETGDCKFFISFL